MPANKQARTIGLIAVILGVMLSLGGLIFFLSVTLAISFNHPIPRIVSIPGLIQLALGVTGAIAGFCLMRGYAKAKIVLFGVAAGVGLNLAFLIVSIITSV